MTRPLLLTQVLFLSCLAAACGRSSTGRDDASPAMPEEGSASDGENLDPVAPALPNHAPYPIILVKGALAYDAIGPVNYFYNVGDHLRGLGFAVFEPTLAPLNTIAARARTIASTIDDVLEKTGARRVHLIGYSQGGVDVRYVVSTLGYGDRVATVTSLGAPQRGVPVADAALGLTDLPGGAAFASMLSYIAGGLSQSEADIEGLLHDLSVDFMTHEFNPANPDDTRVRYYSYVGRTQADPFVDETQVDVVDPIFAATHLWLTNYIGPNDGIVSVTSAEWGQLLSELPADHFDMVGQVLGSSATFDHLQFYSDLAAFLCDPNALPPTYLLTY